MQNVSSMTMRSVVSKISYLIKIKELNIDVNEIEIDKICQYEYFINLFSNKLIQMSDISGND